jgi:DNA-binding MarR family transcriptional regulator
MPDDQLIRHLPGLLAQAHREIHGGLARILKPEGLPVEQWRILETLAASEGLTLTALADRVGMNLPATSKTVDRMVSRALVHRKRHPSDQRSVLILISEFGLDSIRSHEAELERYHAALAGRLGPRGAGRLARLLKALLPES